MKKFVCSLLLVLSALFSMAQNYTSNGGTLEFKSGGTGNFPLIGCIGDDFSITIVDSESLIASVTPDDPSNPTLTYANGTLSGSLVGTAYGTQYQYTVKDGDGEEAGKFILFVMETPSALTITTEATSFTIGKNYMFQVSEAMQTYEWSVTTSQTDGYQFMNQSEASCSLWFLKQGTYILNYNGSSAGGCASPTATYTINVTGSQTITYTASDETLCKDSYAIYQISASESITTTLELHINGQSFSPAGTLNGNDMYCQFDLSGFSSTAGTYTASLVDVLDGNKEVASAQLTFLAAPTVPEISTTAQSFETGENYYTFSATTTTENCSYTWGIGNVPDGGDDIYPNTSNQQNTTISFPVQGTYEIVCQVSDVNGCKALGTYTAEVSEGTSKLSYSVDPIAVCADGNYYDVTVSVSGGEAEYGTYKILIDALTVYEVSTGGTVLSFYVPLGESQAGTHEVTFKDPQNETIATTTMTVSSLPSTPTITSSSETFLAGQTYTFTANTSDSELTYDWTLSGLPYDGASIDGSNTEKTVSVVFNSALEPGQGTFTLYCEVTSNGCKALSQKDIEMSEGATQGDDITYTAQPQVFCLYDGEYDTDFKVEVSGGEVPEGSTFHLTFGDYDIVTDRAYSTIYFELPSTTAAGTYDDVTVWNADKTKQLCTSSLTVFSQGLEIIGSNEGVANTPLEFSVENPGTSDDVTYKWRVLYYGSEDPAESSDYTFSNGNEGSTINVTFLNAGDYYIACQREGQCASGESTHYVEVTAATQTAVCSINGKTYNTLYKALEAVESGDLILVLDDISEADSVITLNSSFTLNTNGHTINFGAIQGMASRTITGGGILNTALENSNTNGSDVLTIDGATLNLNGVQWMAKGMITLTNNASVTLTDGIFLGGGDDDGFNLSIDNTSSFNVNGKSIWGYNYERIASQMSPYLPSGYTVTGTSDGLEFSPDANVTLSAQQQQQIERTYYVHSGATVCSGQTATVKIAAPQGFANPSDIKITGQMGTITPTSVEDTLATFENVQAYRWTLKDGGDNALSFSVAEETLTAEISGPATVTVDEEVTYTINVTVNPETELEYSWGGGVESAETETSATGSFSAAGEEEVFCFIESATGCSYNITYPVTVQQPVVSVSFPQDEYEITIGDSTYVCLNITIEEPNYNLDLVTIALDDTEGGVQFMETQNKGCFYIKALSTAGSSTEVSATVTYNNKEYYATTLVRFKEAQQESKYTLYESMLTVCQGESTTVSFSVDKPGESFVIVSQDNETVFSGVAEYYHAIQLNATTTSTYNIIENGKSKASFTITVNPKPEVHIDGSPYATVGVQTEYVANVSSDNTSATFSYEWLGDVSGEAERVKPTFDEAGDKLIICRVTDDKTCTNADTLTVTVEEPVETEFTISEKSTLSVCQGESATVVITAEPAASFIVVSADNETIYTADNEDYVTLTPTMTTAGDYTYYIVEDGTQKKSFTITVNEKPTVTITALQSVVCVGDEVQLEASMNLSDGSFFWGGADNFDDATSGNPKFVATYDGHYPIFCQVTGTGNCVGTAETSVMVYPTPTVTITGPTEAYVGDEVEYTATLSTANTNIPATTSFTYAWGGGVESYDTETIAKGSFSESDIEEGAEVFCIVSTTDGTCVDTAKYPVTVKAVPATFWATDTVFCYDATGFVTIESSEAINTAAFGVQTADGTPVNFEPVVSPDNNQNNVVVIKYENIRNYGNGTYYITSKGEPVGSFQVVVNDVPRAWFDCPTEAIVGDVWNVSAPMDEAADYTCLWVSDGISFDNPSDIRQSITFETAGPVWVALSMESEYGCIGKSDTCRFTIETGEQKFFVPEEVTWCHGAESGRVTIPVTSNQEIPASLTVNHDWATNIETEINGTEATISFDYPYNGRQEFQLITVEGGDTTVVVENVNAFGKGHLLPSFPEDQDSVVIFGNGNTIELMAGGNAGSTSGSWYTALGSQARFNWTKDDEVSQECLADMINEGSDCNNARVRFTFPQTGTYSVGFSISDDGCYSDAIYKNIYVVDFDPALFSIAPEKDTIEIGAPNGAQFTLNYDGEPYSNYTLKSDGDVTIDGSSVFDNEIVGTFEVYAEVSDLRVATAWITVVERPIEYTVEDVSVCEGTDEAEAVIYASGSIEGKSVTVRDEDDNTFYPEYNDDNDAATVHLNYLSVGTYRYKVYENDVYKTEFTVKVNSLPRVFIECPTDPVVGDTWNPNTAMQEGMTYHWWSDNISSLEGSMSCCPQVTFTEAGDFSATLVVKNNETGCLSEGVTCEFTVGEKVPEYSLNCPDGDFSLRDESYIMYFTAGDITGKTLTWSTNDVEIVTLAPNSADGTCVVNFKQAGTAQIYCQIGESGKETLTEVACTLNIVQPKAVYFSQGTYEVENGTPTTICLTAEGLDLTNAQITYEVSNDKILSVEPSAAATGCAVLTSGVTTTETLSIVATIVVGEETYEATADVHIVEPFVCEGQKIVGGTYIDLEENNFVDGDNYRFKMIGTSNFDGNIIVHIREYVFTEETQSVIISSQVAHEVYKGQEFSFYDLLEISNVVEAGNRAFKLYISPMPNECPTGYDEFGSPVCYGELCQTYYALAKEEKQECSTVAFEYSAADNNYIYSADGLAYEAKDGDKFNVSWTATSDFSGTINLALIDKSAGANYWQEVSSWASIEVTAGVPFSVDEVFTIDGLVSTSPEIALFATVNDQVDGASFCMTNFWFHKLGDIVQECTNYELDGENSVQLQYVYNGDNIAVGDTYNYEVFGTAQFTGDLFFSLVDQSEEVGYWDMLADSKVFSVVEGERFEIKGAFTVAKEPTSSYPEINFTVGRIDANQSGEIKTICVLSSAIYKSNGGDECYNKIVVDGGNSAVLNRVSNYQVSVGEVYEYYVSGVADFTGEAMVSFADASKDADYYFALAEPVTFAVTEGESFSQRGTFVVKNQTPSEYPDFTLMIAKNNGVTGESSSFCIDGAYIEKQVQSYTMSESEVNMFVGGTKYIYLLGDGQPYNGYVEWDVTDLSGSTTPCVTVDYGDVVANSEGQAKIYAKVNDQVVATAIVTVTTFSCDGGELYTVANNGDSPFMIYPLSGIATGDSYKVTINGKTDYDGVLATAVVDFSSVSEDDGPAQGSNLGEIMVKAGQEFSYNTILTVVPTDASAPEYKMIFLLGGSEELDEFNMCATQFSVEKFTAQYTIDGIYDSYMFVGETKQLAIKNIDGTVYGGDAQWISTDENVVAIGNDGYVYAKSEGVAEVQVIIGGDIAATTLINVERATGISIGLDKPGYEIANVGDEQIVYINASGLQAATFTYQYDESIIEVTPIQGTNSLRVKGLKVGSTHLFVTATLNGESYEAGAVVEVGGGSTSNDYTLAFAKSKYEITEGESIRACLTIGEGFKHFDPQFNFDQTVISISNPTDGSDCGVITGLKAGQTFVEVIAEAPDGKFYSAQTEVIVNAKSTQDDYTLAFEHENYEVVEGETIESCLILGSAFEHGFQPTVTYDETIINVREPDATQTNNCATVTGLKAGMTVVTIDVEKDGVHYTAKTHVVVTAKPLPYFVQQSMDLKVGESDQVVVMSQDGGPAQASLFTFETSDATVATVGRDGVVTAIAVGNAEVSVFFENALVGKVMVAVEAAPQMPTPGYNTNNVVMCFDKSATTEGGISLDRMVSSNNNGVLRWYDASGKALTAAPMVSSAKAGKVVYYVSQVGTGDFVNYRESEKVPFTVEVVYVAEPKLNVTDQSTCQGATMVPFVATSATGNTIEWMDATGAVIAEGSEFTPQVDASGYYTYKVTAKDAAGCVSAPMTVTYAVGSAVKPEIFAATQAESYVVGEPVTLGTSNQISDEYSVVWTLGDNEYVHGTSFTTKFEEVGTYTITCKVVETNTGCADSASKVITVEEKVIPLQTIVVEPETVTLYEGEQRYLSLAFTPAFATDRNYNIEVADTSIADVVGLTVFGLKEGVTTATISSTSNSSVSATITITVKKFVAAREISLPTVITMSPEETKTISAAVLPTNASYNEVFFNEKEDNVIRLSANGELTALAEGTSIITAYTKGGLKASSVVVVTASVAAITDIQVPERIEMKVGDSVSVSYKVVPATSLISQLNWTIEDEEMISFDNGVVKAVKAGSTTLKVSFASIEKSITIVVNESDAPVVITTPNVSATQGDDIKVDLTDVISDDNTAVEDLTVTTSSENFNVSVSNGVLTVTPKDNSFVGVDTVTVVITDENNLSVELPVVVEITEIQNHAPEFLMDTIVMKFNACNYVQLSELVSDDFTPFNKMKYTFSSNVKASIKSRKQLLLFTSDPSLESDILTMTATDEAGLTTTKEILLLLTALPNKAPKIAEIPTQNENDSVKFGTIDLAQYVKDDYTSSSAIAWTAADAENIAVTISEGKATVKVLNEFWNGATAVTFYAKDEEGLTDSTVVYYVRNVTIKKEEPSQEPTTEVVATWEGAPSFDFMTMKTIGVPGAQFILMASCSGYDCTWSWDIPGANGVDPTSLMQMITFDEPGTYDVTFTVQSPDGNFEKSITKENFLTVVGINERTPAICKGDAVTLTATEGLDSYYWTTGDVKNTTTARPEATMLYKLTMKKGMFTLVDTVTVKVSVPVALMEDSVMCVGTTFDLEAIGDYVSYAWNTGDVEKAITIPSEVASYTVTAVDDMQCVSVDTFNLTKVNELPAIDLGKDQTPCDGTTVTLDAGAGYEYLWSNGSTEQTIDLTANTETVWARIIDANKCINYDTVVVAFTYPYPEQIGVATFSETTDHIILAWEKTDGVNTVKYRIERETNVTDNWEQVGDDVMFAEAGLVVDEDVNYKQRAYKYRLVTTDGCGNEAVSEVHRSMISTTTRNDDGTKTLQWCAYEPMSNVTQYLVLRGYDATRMDTVDQVPASNLFEIWNETDSKFVNDKDIKYRVVFRLKSEVNENAVNKLDGQPVEGYYTKAESGPFSLALSNIAEAENELDVDDVPFADVIVYPTTFNSYINVAIAASIETNFKVEILNANGQVMARTQTGDINKTLLQIPTDNFKQGVYTVKISDGQQTKTIKVVK